MSLIELQSWLVEEAIGQDLDILTRRTVRTELDNLVAEPAGAPAAEIDWAKLLLSGSILARSDHRVHQEAALRIATGAVLLASSQSVRDAGAVLLSQMSNFRAIALANQRDLLTSDLDDRLGMTLRLEAQRRQIDQAVLVESSGRWLSVNRFQHQFWSKATNHDWLSASAPTASGKSFLVLQWLIDRMLSNDARIAVYLAPTRALVSEIESNLLSLIGKQDGIEISSLPLREIYEAARTKGARLILVFTQERLQLFANTLGDALEIEMLIVDEAQKIGDKQRGVILQDAIERAGRNNPTLKVVFISPGTQNPEELLRDARDGARTVAVSSDTPTVLQNLLLAEQVPRKPKLWSISVLRHDARLPVGMLQLSSSPAGVRKRLAFIAAAAGERGGTLVYANGAAEAEEVAGLISQLVPQVESTDPELVDLADLAKKGVHPNFGLVHLVQRGVGFHYGNMPSLIRVEIERLFRTGKIRFLVCTSTLVEGVNLSCRTIVLRGPRKGIGHPMEPHDFWNLAGRAGRWGNEFQGNIICIDPRDSIAWPSGIPERARFPIKRESDAVLELGDGMADYLDRRATTALAELHDVDQFEQVGSYLLATYLRLGSLSEASVSQRHSPTTIARLEQSLSRLASQIEIRAEMASRHAGVSAHGLQRLLEAFRSYGGEVENLLPATVDSQDSYDRFVTIMRRINQHLFPAFSPDGLIPLHALIVVQWLKGLSLAAMIGRNIEYHRHYRKPYKLATLIRSTMELVEQTARFKAPKYLSAYMDVLNLHLREIGREDLIDHDLDIGTQLEFGVSSRTLLSLMELGLSRMSAVTLYEKIARDDLSKEGCLAWVAERRSQLEGMDMPAIIVREVRDKLLPEDSDQSTEPTS